MKNIGVILLGYGKVGKAFCDLVLEKQDFCLSRFNLYIRIGAILNSRGGHLLDQKKQGSHPELASGLELEESPGWDAALNFDKALEMRDVDVLVDCTPSNMRDGEPALGYTHRALDKKWHVVTANKGPLVVDFGGIRKKADKNNVSLGMSGATAAALPALDIALHSLAGAEINRIEGILNGTTNYVLTRMNEGMEYSVALKEAQDKGIAEPDPSQDVEGWDTAAKILILTNAVLGTCSTLKDVRVEGITSIPSDLLDEAEETGKRIKLMGISLQDGIKRKLETRLSLIESSHPLYGVNGAQKGISFFTDTMDSVTVTGGKSDPKGAAAALLKDIINIYRG
jgi:homoserine dehydrogenase